MLGVFFLDISMVVIEFYGYEEKVFNIQDKMSSKGGFFLWLGIMFLAGFTPLPFKVFTITSGIISFDVVVFLFICLFTRGLRFFLVAYLAFLFGNKFGKFIEKKGALWFTICGILIVIMAVILYLLFK
jgi:membrane protein YqaA with SNARE-associated domain